MERFLFGKNWEKFSKNIDTQNIKYSCDSLKELLKVSTLKGKTFLDIGCGSGIHSIAALKLGAKKVEAFDYDIDSVKTSKKILKKFCPKNNWSVKQASILDNKNEFFKKKFDYIYSWGVLHHTGDMWKALDNVVKITKKNTIIAIAIYNDQGGASKRWLFIKKIYNKYPNNEKNLILFFFFLFFELRNILVRVLYRKNIFSLEDWRLRKKNRGMSVLTDLNDWIGGYPFEVSSPERIFNYFKDKGFILINLKTCGGGPGCNEYVFKKK